MHERERPKAEQAEVLRRVRGKLVEILGGVPLPDPAPMAAAERQLVTEEFHLLLVRSDLLSDARKRVDILQAALELLNEAARKVQRDAALVERLRDEGPSDEEREASAAASRSLPPQWHDA